MVKKQRNLEELAAAAANLLWEMASEVEDGYRTLNEESMEGELWKELMNALRPGEGEIRKIHVTLVMREDGWYWDERGPFSTLSECSANMAEVLLPYRV